MIDESAEQSLFEYVEELTGTFYSGRARPHKLSEIAKSLDVKSVKVQPIDRAGLLVQDSDGKFNIVVNSLGSRARQRVTVAHELGHLILARMAGVRLEDSDEEVEQLCERIAGALLVPGWSLREYFERVRELGDWRERVRCTTLIEGAREFAVSIDLFASRVFREEALRRGSFAVVWRSPSGAESDLRISTSWAPRDSSIFLPRNKTAPADSVIKRAFRRDGTFRASELWRLGSVKGPFSIEARGFMSFLLPRGLKPARGVISIFSD